MLYITKPGLLMVLRVGRFLYYVNFWDCYETATTFLPFLSFPLFFSVLVVRALLNNTTSAIKNTIINSTIETCQLQNLLSVLCLSIK